MPLNSIPSPLRPRKKHLSYCECCHQHFPNLEEVNNFGKFTYPYPLLFGLASLILRLVFMDSCSICSLINIVHLFWISQTTLLWINLWLKWFQDLALNHPPNLKTHRTGMRVCVCVYKYVCALCICVCRIFCLSSWRDFNVSICFPRPLTPMPIQNVCELEPIDDIKAEREVRALQRRGSSLCDHNSSPCWGPCTSRPVGPSPEILLTHLKPPILSPGTQPLTTDIGCQISGTSSPVMPVLAVEAHDFDPSCQLHDTRHSFPSSDVPCPSLDPYSQPPVLSPQVPYVMEPHTPYSEPPVLSPKQTLKEQTYEMETAENLFDCVPSVAVPITTSVIASVDIRKTQEGKRPQFVLEPSDSECPSSHLRSITPFSRRSRSLPRQSTRGQNPKKRCRSASPGNNHAKKRRIIVKFCTSDHLSEPLKPGNDVLANPEAWLSSKVVGHVKQQCPRPKVAACAAELPGLKQTFAILSVPSVETVSHTLNQMDGSVLQHQSDKCHNTDICTCSQDCQPSVAHSTSACIESVLVPDLAMLSSSSSDSNWDCEVLSRLGQNSVTPQLPTDQDFELDKYLLHRPRMWMQDRNYESRLHTALQPSASGKPLFGEDADSSAFSRTVVKIVEVQH